MVKCSDKYYTSTTRCIREQGHGQPHAGISTDLDGSAMFITWTRLIVPEDRDTSDADNKGAMQP